MADIYDVENAMVQSIASILLPGAYDTTNYQPETPFVSMAKVRAGNQSVNVHVRVFRGWPVPPDLNADLKAGISEISVFSVPGMTRNISRHFQCAYVVNKVPITLTATVNANTVTYGGSGTAGQITGIAVGDGIIQTAYCIRLTDLDTPTTVAAALASIIPNAQLDGTKITVPNATFLHAGVASDTTTDTETNLVGQMFDIRIWSPNPQSRDALGSMLTAGMTQVFNLEFPDGSQTDNIIYRGVWVSDATQATMNWQRSLRYEVIYPIIVQTIDPGLLFLGVKVNDVKTVGAFDYRIA